jgi:hypothetical protein
MPIVANEMITHPALNTTQTDAAGGRMDTTIVIPDNVIGWLIDTVREVERTQSGGSLRRYKTFWKFGNSANLTAKDSKLWLDQIVAGDAIGSLIKGNFTNVWSDVASARKYGCGQLADPITAGDVSITVNTEGAGYVHFANGDLVAVMSRQDKSDTTGYIELKRIDQVVTWGGDEATLHFDSPMKYAYPTSRTLSGVTIPTRVASVIEYGDVKGTFSVHDKVSASGTYSTESDAITVDSIAGITQTFTITFDSTTTFQVAGDTLGTLASGSRNTTYEPTNDTYNRPYLSIPPAFWTGTWANGDSVKVTINPCAMPVFIALQIPQDAAPIATSGIYISGECYSSDA